MRFTYTGPSQNYLGSSRSATSQFPENNREFLKLSDYISTSKKPSLVPSPRSSVFFQLPILFNTQPRVKICSQVGGKLHLTGTLSFPLNSSTPTPAVIYPSGFPTLRFGARYHSNKRNTNPICLRRYYLVNNGRSHWTA